MLKKVYGRKFSRNTNSRKALFRTLIFSMVKYGKIETTKIKAKAIQGDIDKIMRLVRLDTLSTRRLVLAKLGNNKEATDKLFGSLKELTTKRISGYTRAINLPNRKGDNAPMARLEWVDALVEEEKKN